MPFARILVAKYFFHSPWQQKWSQLGALCHYMYDLTFLFLFTRHLPDINTTLEAMLQPKVTSLPGHIQAVYVQNIAKLFAKILASEDHKEEVIWVPVVKLHLSNIILWHSWLLNSIIIYCQFLTLSQYSCTIFSQMNG